METKERVPMASRERAMAAQGADCVKSIPFIVDEASKTG